MNDEIVRHPHATSNHTHIADRDFGLDVATSEAVDP